MANASGFFAPSVPNSTLRILPSMGIHQFQRFSTELLCFSATQGAHKSASPSQSRLPRLVSQGCKLVGCGSSVPSLQIPMTIFLSSLKLLMNGYLLAPESVDDEFFQRVVNPEIFSSWGEFATFMMSQMLTCTCRWLSIEFITIQKQLGCKTNPLAYDITAACSGFVLGLISAASHIRGSGFQNVLVVGADALSRYVDWTDRGSCILFGDAAGAVLVQACNSEEDGLFGFDVHSDGNGQRHLNAAIKEKNSNNTLDSSNGSGLGFPPRQSSYSCIQMNGKEVFRFAVRCVPQSIASALEKAGLPASSVDWLLLHQANQRIIEAVATRLEVPSERVISNLANYGNTSAASIPLALDEAVRSGKVKEGQTIAVSGFGAGLSWGSAIIRWG
ncbi:putative beta-ketoacyl-[acyl-carrier-protein] synthase III [Lupinus albus]|uniref:Putative beta-ketoacyl-[acyl-carrier-protein] synthase III n=1 Tax=Lupinus albus TaxID=3870 RepID=A0A6A4NC54_LUPAL|nr:putative beta-ketoacyl-[acyl-carrier-protein] synthase III [Lupinus albus]